MMEAPAVDTLGADIENSSINFQRDSDYHWSADALVFCSECVLVNKREEDLLESLKRLEILIDKLIKVGWSIDQSIEVLWLVVHKQNKDKE